LDFKPLLRAGTRTRFARSVNTHVLRTAREHARFARRVNTHARAAHFNMRDALGKVVAKANLPSKMCIVCARPFTWRKLWERSWDTRDTCSKRCNGTARDARRAAGRAAGGGGGGGGGGALPGLS